MNSSNYVPFCLPDISDDEIIEVVEALKSGWLAKGPKTIEFENKFAEYVGAKYAVAMNSCTAALHISLISAGIGEGDEVITTSMTFAASVNTILHVGAIPIFVDIDPSTGLIDVTKIEEKITSKTKAIVPVHYAGQACDLDKIYELAEKYSLFVSEDAAHAIYTEYKGKRIGYKPMGCVSYSFYATKNLATGEGGMLVTDDEEIANKARMLITHGMSRNAWNRYGKGGSWKYDIEEPGFKYNMFDLQAALGLSQLKRLEEMQLKREEIVEVYREGLSKIKGVKIPTVNSYTTKNAWHLFIIKIESEFPLNRDELVEYLSERNISTSVHFIPVHLMSAYKNVENEYKLPHTEKWFEEVLSLPLYSTLPLDSAERIVMEITALSKKYEAVGSIG